EIYKQKGIVECDPFVSLDQSGVGELIKMAAERGRAVRKNLKIGICGEHVGNVRTALVNFLFARKGGGHFLLRIDDTDKERSKAEYTKAIEEDLRWLGIEWDSTAHQSARFGEYEKAAETLRASGRLYACYE